MTKRAHGMENEVIMGADLGFVQTKASADDWETKFGSIVKPRSEVAISEMADSDGYAIGFDGQHYSVGAKGSYDFTADRLARETDTAKLLGVFGQYQDAVNVSIINTLVTGLPIFEFNNYKKSMEEQMQRVFQYTFGGQPKLLTVQDVLVIPQSAGAYYDYILDDEGEPTDVDLASEDVLVLDIGGRTSDGCIMEASKYSQESFTIFQGVWKAQEALRRLIMQKFQYNMKPYEVDVVMRTGNLRLGQQDHKVSDLIDKAVASVYPEMRDELTLYVSDFRKFAAVKLVGGGAHVYRAFLQDDINTPIIVSGNAVDSEMANARGYRKYGKLRAKQLL